MSIADLHPLDQLYAVYLIAHVFLVAGFAGWFVLNLEKLIATHGDVDLWLNYCFRLFPFMLALYLLWAALDAAWSHLPF